MKNICESISGFFIHSPLTFIFLISSLIIGSYALVSLPREEEPQINVPMVDIYVDAKGLKAIDATQLVTKPLEKIIQGIEGVEHVYSNTQDNEALVTARFFIGEDEDTAILRVHESIRAHLGHIPYGIPMPNIIARGINDVPILVISFSPKKDILDHWQDSSLYHLATKVNHELGKIPDIGESYVIGGHPIQLKIIPDPEKLKLYGITLNQLVDKIHFANKVVTGTSIRNDQKLMHQISGHTFQAPDQIGNLYISSTDGRPVYLNDVCTITLEPKDDEQRVLAFKPTDNRLKPAVSLAIAKRKGANAVDVSKNIINHLHALEGDLIPNSIEMDIIRNYGETAQEKSDSLLMSLAMATLSIVIVIALMVGWREGCTVLFVIPTTLLLTLFCTYLFGYTINRVSLFALIFSIGILVDDAIVITENIQRHWRKSSERTQSALLAVKEIGTPTIMANLTILAALLPMLFVSGMMGPYMSPIPINASCAVILSLLVALILSPWLMLKLYKNKPFTHLTQLKDDKEDVFARSFAILAKPIIYSRPISILFILIVTIITIVMLSFFPLKWVSVKMLPFDNKPELQILVDAPKGTSPESVQRMLQDITQSIKHHNDIDSLWLHVGTASAFNFNGLVRHYYLRNNPFQGEIVVRLKNKESRSQKSHDLALLLRQSIQSIELIENTKWRIVEMPPGPPVLSTLLAEIYAPTAQERIQLAKNVENYFQQTDFIHDVDSTVIEPDQTVRFTLNNAQIEFYGVKEEAVIDTLEALFNPIQVGYSHRGGQIDPIEIVLTLKKQDLQLSERLLTTPIPTKTSTVELGELIDIKTEPSSQPIFRRNGRDIEMVMGELAGTFEAPVYGMLAINEAINKDKLSLPITYYGQPNNPNETTLLWEGEWEVTYTTFRDLGFAFVFAIVCIYILLIIQFDSLKLPILVLVPIPLTFIGIIFGHWIFKAHFTATSMIGFIALAGIIIRNALLFIEFVRQQLAHNLPLQDALMEAGKIRFRPICLTAVTAMIGAAFMIPDPIFEGLGLSLLFGLASSTLLTVLVIPALYVIMRTK